MYTEELEHADKAIDAGGKELPDIIKKLMSLNAKIMTTLTYWI